MPKKSGSEILEQKILIELNNGNDVCQYIINYIRPRTYGSFRTVSKRLKILVNKLYEENYITKEQYEKILEEFKAKQTAKKPTINFDLKKFLENFKELFIVIKDNNESINNLIFLALPFLYALTYKDIGLIKAKDIEVTEITNEKVVIKWTLKGKIYTILMTQYIEEWKYIFNNVKKNIKSEFLFEKIKAEKKQEYTKLSLELTKTLNSFIIDDSLSKLNYITEIKNAVKYQNKDSFISFI